MGVAVGSISRGDYTLIRKQLNLFPRDYRLYLSFNRRCDSLFMKKFTSRYGPWYMKLIATR